MERRRKAQEWIGALARARSGQVVLYWYSVLEAAFVPVPFEAVLAPYMKMRPDIRWRLAAIGVAGYLTVALLAYSLGALFYEAAGRHVLDAMGWRDTFETMTERLLDAGFLGFALAVALPIPTMPVHIAAGVVRVPVEQIIAAVVLVRGIRYFGTGIVVMLYGDRFVAWIQGHRFRR